MATTNKWTAKSGFTQEHKDMRIKSCSCKDIIYNDVEKWFMEDLAFNSLYTSCKERPDLPENKITEDSTISNNNFLRIVSKILTDTENIQSDDGYLPKEREWYYEQCENQIDIYGVTAEQLRSGFNPDYVPGRRDMEFYLYTASCHPDTIYLVKAAMVTFLFNTITSNEMIGYTLDTFRNFPNFGNTVGKKLIEFKEEKFTLQNGWGRTTTTRNSSSNPFTFTTWKFPRKF